MPHLISSHPAECIARVVEHDETTLHERPSQVAPARTGLNKKMSGHPVTGCLTQARNKKRLDPIRNGVSSVLQAPHLKEPVSVSKKRDGSERTHSGGVQKNQETLMTSPSSCSSTERRNARRAKDTMQKGKSSLHMWNRSARSIHRKHKN